MPLVTGLLLAALVFVPLWLRQRTEHLRERVTDVALPARNALLEVQNAFASELAAIRGFELTGDQRFLRDFRAGTEKDRQVTARLLRLAPQLGPEAAADIAELNALKEAWLQEPREAAAGSRSREQLIRSLAEGQRRVDGVLGAADKANAAVIRAETALRKQVASDEGLAAGLVSLLTLSALAVAIAVGWLVRRLNRLAAELRGRVEEEASLHHVAGSLNGAASVAEVGQQVCTAAVDRTRSSAAYLERVTDGAVAIVASTGRADSPGATLTIPVSIDSVAFGNLVLVGVPGLSSYSISEAGYARSLGDLVTAALSRVHLIEGERRSRKEAEEAVRYRDQMVGIVSHDLKNPLHTIGMVMDLLATEPLREDERQEQLRIVVRTLDRMNRLIHDLLDAARVRSGHSLPIVRSWLGTRALVADVAELYGPLASEKKIRLSWDANQAPEKMLADRDRLLQVFSNLIGNAIKFTPEGGRIDLRAERAGNERVRFSVADTGPGIPAEDLQHLFEPFWQAHNRATLGTGLGLSIARAIVEAHGGVIGVESEPGRGTTFTFAIPVAREAGDESLPARSAPL